MRALIEALRALVSNCLLPALGAGLRQDPGLLQRVFELLKSQDAIGLATLCAQDPELSVQVLKSYDTGAISVRLADLDLAVFSAKPNFAYVPDYYGRSWHKRPDIREMPVFGELAAECVEQGQSLLYYDRLYVIFQMLSQLVASQNDQQPLCLAEVGVYKGGTSRFIAAVVEQLGSPDFNLYSCDTFEGHAEDDVLDIDRATPRNKKKQRNSHKPGLFSKTSLETVKSLLSQWPTVNVLQGRIQDTSTQLESKQFHFVHLDMDLYSPTAFALEFFRDRMAANGVIVVDDYGVNSCPGVMNAVNEFLAAHPKYLAVHPLTEQCLLLNRQAYQSLGSSENSARQPEGRDAA